MIGYYVITKRRHEEARSVSRAGFLGEGGLHHLDLNVVNIPALGEAQRLRVEHSAPPHLDDVAHAQGGSPIVAPTTKLLFVETLVGGVEDHISVLDDIVNRHGLVVNDAVLGIDAAEHSLPLWIEPTGRKLICLTEENDFGTDLAHGVDDGLVPRLAGVRQRGGGNAPPQKISDGNRESLSRIFLFFSAPDSLTG